MSRRVSAGRPSGLVAVPTVVALALAAAPAGAQAPALTGQAVNDATYGKTIQTAGGEAVESKAVSRALIAKLQVLLDRRGFSPGAIDGRPGEDLTQAVAALEFAEGLKPDGELDEDVWAALAAEAIRPALVDYEIAEADVAGPFLEEVPEDFRALAGLEEIAYRSPRERLAERFHMAEDLLAELNPGKDFAAPGTVVVVADPGEPLEAGRIDSLEADAAAGLLRAFDAEGVLVAAYPAAIGGPEQWGPEGRQTVRAVALDPEYTYDPEVDDSRPEIRERLVLPPGPNGPVGSVWIDLDAPGCGIHGTAEPAALDESGFRGCVRLTNWDAAELAGLAREGLVVTFRPAGAAGATAR